MHAMNAASSQDDVLPKMSAFFKPGQLVPCVVKALEQREKGNKKNVVLSLRPSLLNQNLAIGNITPGMVCPPTIQPNVLHRVLTDTFFSLPHTSPSTEV